jgi:mevalonate kinase
VGKAVEMAGGENDLKVEIESELPIGSGLGSSAAVSAAVIKAVREYRGEPIENDELFKLTMECEKIAHGNPSGIDPATVVYGGLMAYTKGQPFERLMIKNPLKLLLLNSGKPKESTKEMVGMVASNPDKGEIIERMGKLAEEIKEKLIKGEEVAALLDQNGLELEKLGVVGKRARELSRELRALGASVKVSGAGGVETGSGMMIVMAPDLTKIKKLLDNKQIMYFETMIGAA